MEFQYFIANDVLGRQVANMTSWILIKPDIVFSCAESYVGLCLIAIYE